MSLQSDCSLTAELSQPSSPQETRKQQSSQDTRRQPSSQDTRRQPSSQDTRRQPSSQDTRRQPSSQDTRRQPSSQAEIADDRETDSDLKLVEHAFLYLTDKTYPSECTKNEKRSIRRKADKLVIVSGELFYKKKDGKEVRFILDKDERARILKECHKGPTSGHLGTKRTLARVTERFMWPGVGKDVNNLVANCEVCQRNNRKMTVAAPELHPVPVVSPWFHIGIDFIGPLPVSSQGKRYVLTVSDYFTKFVQAFATETKHACGVADALFKLFMRFGLPRVITSDQGSEFNNSLDTELMEMLGIEHRLTTPYHPQANGLVERFNQTLQGMIVKFIDKKKEQWEDYLDTCIYAYNTSKHESSKYTPFEVMFGRQAVLPVDISKRPPDDQPEMKEFDDDLIDLVMEERRERLEIVKENILNAQKKQKEEYDRKHSKPEVFLIGALVWKKDFTRKKRAGGKLESKWLGPYKITHSLGRGLYRLEDARDPTKVVSRVNGVHLKPCRVPMSELTQKPSNGNDLSSPPHELDNDKMIENSIPSPSEDKPQKPVGIIPMSQATKSSPTQELSLHLDIPEQTENSPQDDDCDVATPEEKLLKAINQSPTDEQPLPLHCSTPKPAQKRKCASPTCSSYKPVCKKVKKNATSRNEPARKLILMQRQGHSTSKKPAVTAYIDVSAEEGISTTPPNVWKKTDKYELFQSDREILLHPAAWLNDNIISAAQALLQKQNPLVDGFQPPCLGQMCAFDIQSGEFVQILHDGHGHWLTVSTVGAEDEAEVYVYDSMYPSVGTYTKKEVASILCTKKKVIKLKIMDVQMQAGGSDCGLFAVAFATALANGIPPGKFTFDQSKMRKHLYACLQKGRITMFPTMKERRIPEKVKCRDEIKIYCECRMPELRNVEMVECNGCREWYHVHCVCVPHLALKDKNIKWFCSSCSQ